MFKIIIYNEKCAKYLKSDLKQYRGVIFHDTERWCKIWRKTDLNMVNFHQSNLKSKNWDIDVIL